MTALHVGTASICAERRVPVMPGWIDAEMTVGVVSSGMRRGGSVGERDGSEGLGAETVSVGILGVARRVCMNLPGG